MNNIENESYNDNKSRDIAIDFFKQAKNIDFEYGDFLKIDLTSKDNSDIGAEVERGKWVGNLWTDEQSDRFNLGVKTVNISHRKFHYWNLQDLSDKYECKIWEGVSNKGWNKNFFLRINYQGDQICLIDASTIIDENKRIFITDRKVRNNSEYEDWLCIPEKYVETWNKQPNGIWKLNGYYPELSEDEKEEIKLKNQKEGLKNARKIVNENLNQVK